MVLTDTKVGSIKDIVTINAAHVETGTVIGINSKQSSNVNNGAGFTF